MSDPAETSPQALGGGIAGKIASTVVDATVHAKTRLAGHTVGVANQAITDFTNHVSDEIRTVMGDLWQKLANDPETPESFKPLMQSLATERGQAWAWIGGTATGAALGAGILGLLTNEFAPVINKLIAANPHGVLSPDTAAQAYARNLGGKVVLEFDASANGIDDNRFAVLTELARSRLTADETVEAFRRGLIGESEVDTYLHLAGYGAPDRSVLKHFRDAVLSPTDAAAAWARSELTEDETDRIGRKSGVSTEDMKLLRALAGQPPGPEELLFAWRRGIINESDVDRGLIQGPIRNEWLKVIKALQWQPLPTSEAADAVNQGHMTIEKAKQAAKENGVTEEDFQIFIDNAGIPPGPQEALDWVNRGLITEAEFRTAFLESRIKNKYIDLYLKSRFYVLPPDTIRLLYSRGAFTQEQAVGKLMERGLTAEDAAAYVAGASAQKTEKSRDLTVAQTLELRADGLITNEDAMAMLEAAGYDADEALWVTELADLRRVARFVTAAINRTKASYIAGRLDEIQAGAVLDSLNLPASYKESAFQLWDLEKTTVTKGLTTAQVVAAVKSDLLTPEQGIARLTGQGYAQEDAVILLVLGKAISAPS